MPSALCIVSQLDTLREMPIPLFQTCPHASGKASENTLTQNGPSPCWLPEELPGRAKYLTQRRKTGHVLTSLTPEHSRHYQSLNTRPESLPRFQNPSQHSSPDDHSQSARVNAQDKICCQPWLSFRHIVQWALLSTAFQHLISPFDHIQPNGRGQELAGL